MLGNEVLSVRLGGVYALEHLAEEYPSEYHVQVMRIFSVISCAIQLRIRTNMKWQWPKTWVYRAYEMMLRR